MLSTCKRFIQKTKSFFVVFVLSFVLFGVLMAQSRTENVSDTKNKVSMIAQQKASIAQDEPTLVYLGQASIRIISENGKVIYIDPYAGADKQYVPVADVILVTHTLT